MNDSNAVHPGEKFQNRKKQFPCLLYGKLSFFPGMQVLSEILSWQMFHCYVCMLSTAEDICHLRSSPIFIFSKKISGFLNKSLCIRTFGI